MKRWLDNKFLDALCKSIILFGMVHMGIRLVAAYKARDIYELNLLRVIEVQLVSPEAVVGATSFFLSLVVFLIVYLVIFRWWTDHQ